MKTDLAEVSRSKGLIGGVAFVALVTSWEGFAVSCAKRQTEQGRIVKRTRTRSRRTADTSMQVKAYQIHSSKSTASPTAAYRCNSDVLWTFHRDSIPYCNPLSMREITMQDRVI